MIYCFKIIFPVYSDLRLINMQEIIESRVAYEVADFQSICQGQIDTTIGILKSKWIPSLQNIFLLVSPFAS